jgi:hypothetical protein
MVCSHAALPILAIILHQHCTYSAGACTCLAFPTLAPLALLALFAPFAQLSLLALSHFTLHVSLTLLLQLALLSQTCPACTNVTHTQTYLNMTPITHITLNGQVASCLSVGGANFI